jgi:hypothetical protein
MLEAPEYSASATRTSYTTSASGDMLAAQIGADLGLADNVGSAAGFIN